MYPYRSHKMNSDKRRIVYRRGRALDAERIFSVPPLIQRT
jgi:hypothetical protein